MITEEQFKTLVRAMKSVYRDPAFIANNEAFNMWFALLKDLSYEELSFAVKTWMQTEEKEPTVAGLRIKANDAKPMDMTALEAWGVVRNAVTRSGYGYKEEYAALPPELQKSVGVPENLRDWSQVEIGTLDTVIQSQFIKNYYVVKKRTEEAERTSPEISSLIGNIQQRMVESPKRESLPTPKPEETFSPAIEDRLKTVYRRLGVKKDE